MTSSPQSAPRDQPAVPRPTFGHTLHDMAMLTSPRVDARELFLAHILCGGIPNDRGDSWEQVRGWVGDDVAAGVLARKASGIHELVLWLRAAARASGSRRWTAMRHQLVEELVAAQQQGARVVTVLDEEYPLNLRCVPEPPPFIFYRGSLDVRRDAQSVAISSVRRVDSPEVLERGEHAGHELAQRGLTVVSGVLAEAERAALRGAIEAGGRAVAVLLCSHGSGYRGQEELCDDIVASGGAVMSWFWPSEKPNQYTFRCRNELAVNLSRAVVVIEPSATDNPSEVHSRLSRVEAGLAASLNRLMFVMPSPTSAGSWTNQFLAETTPVPTDDFDHVDARLGPGDLS